jgi:hypothetical protein
MPSKSAKQHRFMEAAAHNPKFAAKAGVPQSVAKEFVAADEAKGGDGSPGRPYVKGSNVHGKRR